MEKGEKFFSVNPEKCIGCNLCEFACSLEKTGEFNPLQSRIRIVRMSPLINQALTCKLCDDPLCVDVCMRKALSQSKETRIIRINSAKCDGCGLCIEACPYGAIRHDESAKAVVICDLCDGKPVCMEICPVEAIEFSATDKDYKAKWTGAYKKWIDESKKFIQLTEGEDIDIFAESMEIMEKLEDKLKLLFEKKSSKRGH